MNEIEEIMQVLLKFRNERDWGQFHNPKDLALALSIEAAELNEAFLWKKPEEANIDKVRDELADVFAYAFLLAHHCGLDINEIIKAKVAKNEEKYPVEKSKGSAKKYNEL